MVDDKDSPIITIEGTGDAEQQSLTSEFEIFRDDLANILYDLSRSHDNVRYVFGEQVQSMRQDKDRVAVGFANGQLPPSNFDLVVAADGSTSRTRALGLECDVHDHIKPLNAWAAYCTVPRDLLQGGKMGLFSTSIPGRAIIRAPDHKPEQNRVVLMCSHGASANARQSLRAFRETLKKGDAALKYFLCRRFQGHPRCDDILPAVRDSDNLYASEAVQVKVPSLQKGHFALVGDAGYAPGPIGTGTSLAITGAYVLAGEINDHLPDLQAGLRSYERKMRPIIDDMQHIPPGFPGIMTPQTKLALALRNAILRLAAVIMLLGKVLPVATLFSWMGALFSSSFGTDKYALSEYYWKE